MNDLHGKYKQLFTCLHELAKLKLSVSPARSPVTGQDTPPIMRCIDEFLKVISKTSMPITRQDAVRLMKLQPPLHPAIIARIENLLSGLEILKVTYHLTSAGNPPVYYELLLEREQLFGPAVQRE